MQETEENISKKLTSSQKLKKKKEYCKDKERVCIY